MTDQMFSKGGAMPTQLPAFDRRLSDGWLLTPLDGHPDAIAACGWSEAPEPPAIDDATEQLGWDGAAWTIEPLSAEEITARAETRRVAARAAVDARAEQAFFAGFAPANPAFAGQRLQVRGVEDRTNWLTSQASYAAAVDKGYGDVVDASFRTAANTTVTVSYADGLDTLLGMAAWGRAILARSWAIKDAIAVDEPYDLDTGWPA
ncbi:hypothetical protein [Sphingomonas oligophenolica]|uniref:DUF4376 domain-containing protein n=1 Tax=Sphingomonas oligophenolica TaxID=301154 RepID=A0A502CQH0_9SPHN|nr:hypothetical protein [Sphingomonas oligophenolica]TPG14369.1 hypothetical protein EAH84_03410 [Sphingomonas oligophenolica]